MARPPRVRQTCLRRSGTAGADAEMPDGRPIPRLDKIGQVTGHPREKRRGKVHFHVRLPGTKPDIADENVLPPNRLFSGGNHQLVGCFAGFQGGQFGCPSSCLVCCGPDRLPRKTDRHDGAWIIPSPNRQGLVPLQHGVVGKQPEELERRIVHGPHDTLRFGDLRHIGGRRGVEGDPPERLVLAPSVGAEDVVAVDVQRLGGRGVAPPGRRGVVIRLDVGLVADVGDMGRLNTGATCDCHRGNHAKILVIAHLLLLR